MEETQQSPQQPIEQKVPEVKTRQCPHCGQQMPIKDIWKQLWRWPTLNEWLILFMMAMMIFAAWAYKHDIQVCRDFIENGTGMFVGNLSAGNGNTQTYTFPNITLILNDTVSNVSNITR
jgi:hypothetical protein